jgi:hypothetical protein
MAGRRTALALLAASTTLVVLAVPAAGAATPTPVASWAMNENRGARVMVDGSGNRLNGTIGHEVRTGTTVNGSKGYRFDRLEPDTPPPHPGHLVTVADHPSLDPGSRQYIVTVRLRTTYHFGNIIQKGQATVAGGNFKLQIPSGKVQCLFRGSKGSIQVSAKRAINDGAWHTVRCERASNGVVLTIDGRVEARVTGWTGPISNSWPLSIGGKTSCDQRDVGCDYYAGDIDRVSIDVR